MPYYDLYVRAPAGSGYNDPNAMRRVDEHLIVMFPASFLAPKGVPVKMDDGTYPVRIYDGNVMTLRLVRRFLERHYGLKSVKLVKYSDTGEKISTETLESKLE